MLYVKIVGGLLGSCALVALAQAISLSYGSSHKPATYVAWYALTGLLALAAGACYLLVRRGEGGRAGADDGASTQREDRPGDVANLTAGDHGTASIFQNSSVTNHHYGVVPSPLSPGDLGRPAHPAGRSSDHSEPPLHRAIANGISELETVRRMLQRASETGELQKKTPHGMQRTLGDLLTDQGWHQSRSILDEAYGACEDFYDRLHVPSRRFEGPMSEMVTPRIEASDDLPSVLAKVERAISELRSRQGSSAVDAEAALLTFDHVSVGKPRTFFEHNEFHASWRGVPVVFDLVNPQGGPRATAVRPTVTVKGPDGTILAGPVNARWSTPEPGRTEEVERDIPANGALVGVDTLVQPVAGDRFWLATDDGLRAGLKSGTDSIDETDVLVTLAIQGENFPKISETVRVRLGFPLPALGDEDPTDTLVPPSPAESSRAPSVRPPDVPQVPAQPADARSALAPDPAADDEPVSAASPSAEPDDSLAPSSSADRKAAGEVPRPRPTVTRSLGLKGDLEEQRDEGYKLLSALKGGLVVSWQYDRIPTAKDVESWAANVEYLLRNNAKLLLLFRWKPLKHRAIANIREVLISALGSTAAADELQRLLGQLEKVIEEL